MKKFLQQTDKQKHILIAYMCSNAAYLLYNIIDSAKFSESMCLIWILTLLTVSGVTKETNDVYKENPTGFSFQDLLANTIGYTLFAIPVLIRIFTNN